MKISRPGDPAWCTPYQEGFIPFEIMFGRPLPILSKLPGRILITSFSSPYRLCGKLARLLTGWWRESCHFRFQTHSPGPARRLGWIKRILPGLWKLPRRDPIQLSSPSQLLWKWMVSFHHSQLKKGCWGWGQINHHLYFGILKDNTGWRSLTQSILFILFLPLCMGTGAYNLQHPPIWSWDLIIIDSGKVIILGMNNPIPSRYLLF